MAIRRALQILADARPCKEHLRQHEQQEDGEPTGEIEIAVDAQRHFFGRDRGGNGDDTDVEQLEAEQRPGDCP
jgi:hypothetical protein